MSKISAHRFSAWIEQRPTTAERIAQLLFAAAIAYAAAGQGLHAGTLPDFATIWAAQHTSSPYSTAALQQVLGTKGLYVYPYLPTALVLTAPLRLGGYAGGYLAWCVLSACAVVGSLRATWAPIVLAVPAVILSGLNGQTSLFMAALLIGAVQARDRPQVAGLLYGVAAGLKPQVGLLIPVFLLAAGQWRTIGAAAATIALIGSVSLLAYGPGIWARWAASLPAYLATQDARLAHRYLSLPGTWRALPLALGAIGAFRAGRRQDYLGGTFLCLCAAILGSVHAMDYDEAILVPFALATAAREGWRGLPFLAPLLFWPSRLATIILTGFALTSSSGALGAASGPGPARDGEATAASSRRRTRTPL